MACGLASSSVSSITSGATNFSPNPSAEIFDQNRKKAYL